MSESRDKKLHDLLLNDKELFTDLLDGATLEELRETMRTLLLTPVFDELNKRSLLGRVIKICPELQSMISGESARRLGTRTNACAGECAARALACGPAHRKPGERIPCRRTVSRGAPFALKPVDVQALPQAQTGAVHHDVKI